MPHFVELVGNEGTMSSNSDPHKDGSLVWERHRASSNVVFAAVAVILKFYLILQCYFYRTPRAGNQASRRDLNELHHDDDHHHSIQIQGRGLELSVVSSLPTLEFKKNEGSNRECAICLGEFEEGEGVKRLPRCAHVFHVFCIATWFRSHSNCPICRSNVNDPSLALTSESSDSHYASPEETFSSQEFSPERPLQLGRPTTPEQHTRTPCSR